MFYGNKTLRLIMYLNQSIEILVTNFTDRESRVTGSQKRKQWGVYNLGTTSRRHTHIACCSSAE